MQLHMFVQSELKYNFFFSQNLRPKTSLPSQNISLIILYSLTRVSGKSKHARLRLLGMTQERRILFQVPFQRFYDSQGGSGIPVNAPLVVVQG